MAERGKPSRVVRFELEIDARFLRSVGKAFMRLGYLIGVTGGLIEIFNNVGGH
jgi:hypothetical protein